MIQTLAKQTWVHVAVAFVAMGGWALFANMHHPMPKPALAAFTQGALSGIITFGLKTALDALRGRVARSMGWWLPPLLACSASLLVLVGVHILVATPEVIRTISVPFSVASTYAVAYNLIRFRKESAND